LRQRIKQAKAILGPHCDDASVEAAVKHIIVREERSRRWADIVCKPTNKQEKAAVAQVAQALRRLNVALKNTTLPNFVREMFPGNLGECQTELESLGLRPLAKPRRSSGGKRLAAEEAAYLLEKHKLSLATTRGGKFHQLAAVLYGDDDADLFNHCRTVRDVSFD
jgi:hypothetical protein